MYSTSQQNNSYGVGLWHQGGTSNLAARGSEGAIPQPTDSVVGGQTVLPRTQRRNKRRQQRRKQKLEAKAAVTATLPLRPHTVHNPEKAGGTQLPWLKFSTPSPAQIIAHKEAKTAQSWTYAQEVNMFKMGPHTTHNSEKVCGTELPWSKVSTPFPAQTTGHREATTTQSWTYAQPANMFKMGPCTTHNPEKAYGMELPWPEASTPFPAQTTVHKRARTVPSLTYSQTANLFMGPHTSHNPEKADRTELPWSKVSTPSPAQTTAHKEAGTTQSWTYAQPADMFKMGPCTTHNPEKAYGMELPWSEASTPFPAQTTVHKRARTVPSLTYSQTANLFVGPHTAQNPEMTNGTELPRSEVSTPSLVQTTVHKMARTVQSRTYPQMANLFKMAVVKEAYPKDKLSQEDIKHIHMEILKRTDMIPEGDHMPKIQRSTTHAGALLVFCNDAETAEWLKWTLHGNGDVVGGTTLKVLSALELLKPIKVAFKTKDVHTKDPVLLVRRLTRLNPELKLKGWRFLQKVEESHTIRWIFQVDQEAAESIKNADFGAYTGVDRGIFKILNDPNTRTKDVQVEPPTSSQEPYFPGEKETS